MRRLILFTTAMLLLLPLCLLTGCNGTGSDADASQTDQSSGEDDGTTGEAEETENTEESTEREGTPLPTELTEIENGTLSRSAWYRNALTAGAADPFVLQTDDYYYMYSTGSTAYYVMRSSDLRNWKQLPDPVLKLSDFPWAKEKCWAPEVYAYQGKYYMIFSAKGTNGLHAIDVGVSTSPTGPFKPLLSSPLYAPAFSVIDASLLFDNGHIYLFYSKDNSTNYVNGKRTSQTWGVEVNTEITALIGEPVLIATPTKSWEAAGSVIWNEGPVVFRAENGKYYLLYSANYYQNASYSVGYAVSDSPLGPYTKPSNNRILYGDGKTVTGPGHCNLFRSPDGTEFYLCYHRHTTPPNSDEGRSFCYDRLYVEEDGTLYADGPTTCMLPIPSGANGLVTLHDYTVTIDDRQYRSGKADDLTDGHIQYTSGRELKVYDGAQLSVTLGKTAELRECWIYTSDTAHAGAATFDLLLNDVYLVKGVPFSQLAGDPCVILPQMPEGTRIDRLTVTVHLDESKMENGNTAFPLTELILVAAS